MITVLAVIAVGVVWSLVARPSETTAPTAGPTVSLAAPTVSPTLEPTPSPTIEPTPIPTVPAAFAPVPAALLITKGGPQFPLPDGALVTSDRPIPDGSWRLTAIVANQATADAFYGALNDAAWPPSTSSNLSNGRGFNDASGQFATANVRVYAMADGTAEIIVTFAPATPGKLPGVKWLDGSIPDPNGALPSSPPLAGFPAAWRPAGLTVVAETEGYDFFEGFYIGSADLDTLVAAYQALAREATGAEPTTEYSDDRTEVLITSSVGFVALIIENGTLQVAIEVAR